MNGKSIFCAENLSLKEVFVGCSSIPPEAVSRVFEGRRPPAIAHWTSSHDIRISIIGPAPTKMLGVFKRAFTAPHRAAGFRVLTSALRHEAGAPRSAARCASSRGRR